MSEQWIKKATSRHSLDVNNGSHDWTAGYGYQFWLNDNGKGYHGDGAFETSSASSSPIGKSPLLCLPKRRTCKPKWISLWTLLSTTAHRTVRDELPEDLYAPAPTAKTAFSYAWHCEENAAGIRALRLDCDGEVVRITRTDARGEETIRAGNGRYAVSDYTMTKLYPCISQLEAYAPFEKLKAAAFYTLEDGAVTVTLRHLESPHTEYWHFSLGEEPEWSLAARTGPSRLLCGSPSADGRDRGALPQALQSEARNRRQ